MIKAVANGSGGSTQFGIRAPWMAQRKFKPIQGSPKLLSHYFGMIDNWADSIGVATPLFDRAVELYQHLRQDGSRRRQRCLRDDRRAERHAREKNTEKEISA